MVKEEGNEEKRKEKEEISARIKLKKEHFPRWKIQAGLFSFKIFPLSLYQLENQFFRSKKNLQRRLEWL